MPTFSVIIPTYNSQAFIEETVMSVLNQTYYDFELIIINDGSNDNTAKILGNLKSKNSRIQVITTPNSGGPTVPTNIGIANSKGKYVTFLDHDDTWVPTKLQILLDHFNTNPHIGFIGSNVEIVNEVNKTHSVAQAPSFNSLLSTKTILSGNYFNTFSMMAIKKEIFTMVGFLDTDLFVFADYEMMVRLTSYNIPHLFIDTPLVKYRIHQNNASSLSRSALRRATDLEKITNKYNDLFLNNKKSLSHVYSAISRIYLHLNDTKSAFIFSVKAIENDILNPVLYIKFLIIPFGGGLYTFFSKVKNKTERKVS